MSLSTAQWIGLPGEQGARAAPLLRRVFTVDKPVTSARLDICGLGYYEASINGRRVGDSVLDPAQTDYELRCLYATYDVTKHLRPGVNTIGVMLGDGWFNQYRVWNSRMSYGQPRLLAELTVLWEGGAQIIVRTDLTWRGAAGPVMTNNVYAGECYDARQEKRGWDTPGFDDSGWKAVELVSPPGGRLELQAMPPIKIVEELRPVSITQPKDDCHVVDMGQNFAGWARIRLKAPAGTTVRLRFAEALGPDGMIDMGSTGTFCTGVEQTDTYICGGSGVETWQPRFTYHGFRYVEVCGWPGGLVPEDITGVVVHTALPPAGKFECSDDRLNLLHRMALWTHRSNIHGVPTDCPARERCGWLGDAHIVCEYSIYNFQGLRFWEKYLGDIETSRALHGGLPCNVVPGKRGVHRARPDWMAATILIPWYLYVYYGLRPVLERHWDGMRTVIEHFHDQADGWILGGGFGDWCDPRGSVAPTYTPEELTTTIWFRECARIIGRVAQLLQHQEESRRYAEWADAIGAAFKTRWYDSQRNTFGSQTADAMALHFGLVPDGKEQAVVRSLVQDIRETHAIHHTVGIMGVRYLFEELTRHGHGATALDLLHQDTYPSFGDLIRRGATTLWENWGEPEIDKKDGQRSLNHPMMGGFDNWFYNTLAGIRPDPEQPGFRHFYLEPHPIRGLSWVKAYHDCPHGRIRSEWRIAGGRFTWKIAIPEGSRATAVLPYTNRTCALKPGACEVLEEMVIEKDAL